MIQAHYRKTRLRPAPPSFGEGALSTGPDHSYERSSPHRRTPRSADNPRETPIEGLRMPAQIKELTRYVKRRSGRTVAVLAATALAPLSVLTGPAAVAASSPSSSLNRSVNPILANNMTGYSIQEGGSGLTRVAVTDHVAAKWAARVTSSASTTRIREPRAAVTAGQTWSFATDVKARTGAAAQITVSWYTNSGTWLSWTGGTAVAVSPTTWTRVAATLVVPTNATVAEIVVNVTGSAASAPVTVTQEDVRAPVTITPIPTPTPTPTPPATGFTALPAQSAGLAYGSTSGVTAYAHSGGLVVAGRDNYQAQAFKDVSSRGGSVLIYLDAMIDNKYGRYHDMLNNASSCGPATSRWPGSYSANSYGYLNDFRVGSTLQSKLACVLEAMVTENPHMAGWFADDLGSRSWFPALNWSSFPDKAAYRAGAIALTQTLRTVANRHGLIVIVNGTWSAGDGGGYPDANQAGNALADGGFVEHHDGQIGYFGPYGCSAQWAAQSPVTQGKAFNYAVTSSASGLTEYRNSNCFAYVHQQSGYDSVPAPWGGFHATGLPSRVMK